MQTLLLPEVIHINFLDKEGNTLRQKNILVGIHTFATRKNNINLSPFLSDKDGQITITKQQLQNRADIFISYGIMDYNSLETAKPDIQIYFWGTDSLNGYVHYWKTGDLQIREREELHLFETCFNRTTNQRQDIILVNDTWDTLVREKNYEITLSV
jgi:hypothetical protein